MRGGGPRVVFSQGFGPGGGMMFNFGNFHSFPLFADPPECDLVLAVKSPLFGVTRATEV